MEINPRLWGSLALAIDAGVNFPAGLLDLACGRTPPPQPAYRPGVHTRNIVLDVHWLKANLRASRKAPWLLTRSRLGSFFELMRPLAGRESWDHFDRHDLGVTGVMLRQVARELFGSGFSYLRDASLKRAITSTHQRIRAALGRREKPIRNVLFLCYGNICRSPFAAALARARLPGLHFESAGFHRTTGRRTPPDFVTVASSLGVDVGRQRSQRVTAGMVDAADLVLVMDLENYRDLRSEFPGAIEKTTLLGLFAADPHIVIDDPWSVSEANLRRILSTIQASVEGLAAALERAPSRSTDPKLKVAREGSPGPPA
jgi:protein-tyrosine-phosphatase